MPGEGGRALPPLLLCGSAKLLLSAVVSSAYTVFPLHAEEAGLGAGVRAAVLSAFPAAYLAGLAPAGRACDDPALPPRGLSAALADVAAGALVAAGAGERLAYMEGVLESCEALGWILGPPVGALLYARAGFPATSALWALLCAAVVPATALAAGAGAARPGGASPPHSGQRKPHGAPEGEGRGGGGEDAVQPAEPCRPRGRADRGGGGGARGQRRARLRLRPRQRGHVRGAGAAGPGAGPGRGRHGAAAAARGRELPRGGAAGGQGLRRLLAARPVERITAAGWGVLIVAFAGLSEERRGEGRHWWPPRCFSWARGRRACWSRPTPCSRLLRRPVPGRAQRGSPGSPTMLFSFALGMAP
ncbi:unnamed protein product [Prorocentrum cordatum]|uniref:Solute carrier family 40 protein n=1 Tax=Prorocentrum cordatum TaxID=2364126 RepID=A0ABN9PD93_9DINO|nr:unnamed protein product [Polarella glacialis]